MHYSFNFHPFLLHLLPLQEEVEEKVEIKLDFPEFLKNWLIDDWDLITRQKMVRRNNRIIKKCHFHLLFIKPSKTSWKSGH